MGKQSQAQRSSRWSARKWIAAGIFLLAALLVASVRWYYPAPPTGAGLTSESLLAWLQVVAASGPVHLVLLPFRLLIRPAFAQNAAVFLTGFAYIFVVMALLYACIRRSGAEFVDSVLGGSGDYKSAGSVPIRSAGRQETFRPRRPLFQLKPAGSASIAIFWKNLSLIGGFNRRRSAPVIAILAVVSIGIVRSSGNQWLLILGSASMALAGFLTLMGPVLFREDLRTDMQHADLLKTYPVRGWEIVLGEAMGPAAVLSSLLIALIMMAASTFPGTEKHAVAFQQRIYIGTGAALLLPSLVFVGVLFQNATVLLLPGWVELGREHAHGIEAMGQRLISSLATVVFLLIAAVPAALLFLAAWVAGYWLIGLAITPVASLVAAAGLVAESVFAVLWLGRVFDRLDLSKEQG